MPGYEIQFEPSDVMDYVKQGAQEGLNALKADLSALARELDDCQDVFHGSNRSGTNSGIYQIYENFSTLIGRANGGSCSGAWGTAYSIRELLNLSYKIAKETEELQEQAEYIAELSNK